MRDSRIPSGFRPVQSILRAHELLSAFRDSSESLRLTELVRRTGLNKSTAFRMLTTLVQCGLVAEVAGQGYQLRVQLKQHPCHRLGYALQSSEFAFSRTVADSLQRSAAAADVELLLLDN